MIRSRLKTTNRCCIEHIHHHSLKLSPPNPRGNDSMSPSHSSRLKYMGNLGINGLVVASPTSIGTVSRCIVIGNCQKLKFARKEERQPLIKHNVLVGGNGELASTIEHPLIFA